MGLSQEVRFKITGDTSGLDASFKRSESIAERAGRKLEESIKKRMPKGLRPGGDAEAFWGPTPGEMKRLERYREIAAKERADEAKAFARGKRSGSRGAPASDQGQDGDTEASGKPESGAVASRAFRFVGAAVAGALRSAIAWSQSRVRVDEARGESNASGLDSLRATLASIGGLQGQLTQGRGSAKDLERQRQEAQQRVEFLSTPAQKAGMALDAANPFGGEGFGQLEKAEKSVAEIDAKIQAQHGANQLTERELKRQLGLYEAQSKSVDRIGQAAKLNQLNRLGELEIQKEQLAESRKAEEKYGTPEAVRAIDLKQRENARDIEIEQQQRRLRGAELNQEFSNQAAEGRTFSNGRARPLSETERLARRAQQFRERARQGILTGAGSDAGRLIQSAITTEASVAGRLESASSGVKPLNASDATGIKPEIIRSNQILQEIRNSLTLEEL